MPDFQDDDDFVEGEREAVKQDMLKKKEEQLKVVPYMECGIQYTDIKNFYERGHGIDFYIDQARYLPDGCTVTRLIIRGITNTNDKMIGSTKTYSEINDSTR